MGWAGGSHGVLATCLLNPWAAPSKWPHQADLPLSIWQMGIVTPFLLGNSKSPNRLPAP